MNQKHVNQFINVYVVKTGKMATCTNITIDGVNFGCTRRHEKMLICNAKVYSNIGKFRVVNLHGTV